MVESGKTASPFSTGDLYSTAFGFYSRISSSVDPRTGTFTAKVDLSTGKGNRLRGPRFEFRLVYNSLDTRDEGFGEGWRLGVTELDTRALMLTLSEGDQHKVTGLSPDEDATFPDRKLDSFSLRPGPYLLTADVTHATGVVEHLARPGPDAPSSPLRTTRISSPNGDTIHLEWDRDLRGNTCLVRVFDETDNTDLLTVSYGTETEPETITLTLYTGLASPVTVRFIREGYALRRIAVPLIIDLNDEPLIDDEDEAVWEFIYVPTLDAPVMHLLERVVSPDGTRDEVTYIERALQMPPGAPRAYMPAVSTHMRLQHRTGTVLQASSYDFNRHGGRNYFGYPVVRQWEDRTDQLLHWGGSPFEYGSRQILSDGDTELSIIDRTFNHFHLATSETTTRGSIVREVVITYGTNPDLSFDDQPKAFQFPHRATTTVYDTRDPEVKQITVVDSTYDNNGHLLSRHDSGNGITEVSVYYPIEGEGDLCPPDPLHIVTRLKSRTTYPGPGGGPVLNTLYHYCEVPVVAGTVDYIDGRTVYVQACAEILSQEGITTPLVQRTQSFFTDQSSQHGAVSTRTRTQDGLTETSSYIYRLDIASGTVTTETERRTHDGIILTSSETKLLVSGLGISSTDEFGNRTDFEYDDLGRMTRRIEAPDAPDYRTENQWKYQLSMTERWIHRIGVMGLSHRTWVDEQYRVVRHEQPLPDGQLMTVREVTYDTFGQPTVDLAQDLLNSKMLILRKTTVYDDWGEPARVSETDGSITISERGLVDDDGDVVLRTTQWRETSTGQRIGGWQSADTNAAKQLRRRRAGWWDEDEPIAGTMESWNYDGLGRCVAHTDTRGLVTQQGWDAFGRLVSTALPNGDVIGRTYAAGHEKDLVATITITPLDGEQVILGRREHDGLGRLISDAAGSLVRHFTHIPRQMNPDTRRLPGGGTIKSTYDRRLNEVLTSETLVGHSEPLLDVTYDHQRRLPKSVAVQGNSMAIGTDYLGRMTQQDVTLSGEPARHSQATLSPGGLTLTVTGVDGVVQTLDYDDAGRLATQTDRDAVVAFTYDALSRVESRTTAADHDAARTIEQRFAYDDLGRVERVTWTYEGNAAKTRRSLVLRYREDNKVIRKQWLGETDDQLLREEAMDYDSRGRLIQHEIVSAADVEHPVDEAGNPYRLQTFTHDALDNLLSVTTTLADGRINTTTYTYDSVDRDRLIGVGNTLPGYPGHGLPVRLMYDDNGHLIDDGSGHTMIWDDSGRLSSVTLPNATVLRYSYGANGRIARVERPGSSTARYDRGGALYCEFTGNDQRRFIRANGAVVAETRLANAVRKTWLLGADPQGSVLVEGTPDV
ncbi:hypothetical protein ACQKIE_12040 [Luteibacter sp. NPDC031894]|uniref:RHS repeat domain-containing protein n=1 Tax=Luteibacter sp. NPDC031894 TaxID=3390572 RepID=UPI003D08B6A8